MRSPRRSGAQSSPANALSEPASAVSCYGFFTSPSDAAAECAWREEALAVEVSWWSSDFLLYLSWRKATGASCAGIAQSASPLTVPDSSTRTASPPSARPDVDVELVERWFWQRWKDRLRAHGGCPHMSLRCLLWGFFAGAWQQTAEQQRHEERRYVSLNGELAVMDAAAVSAKDGAAHAAAALEAIDRDVGRTLPDHTLFQGTFEESVGQQQLRRLLHAYAALDPEVGYCQGMGFVAAVVLLVAPEVQAFQIFCALLRDPCTPSTTASTLSREASVGVSRHGMRQLYRSGFPLLLTLLTELESQMELLLPALAAHLRTTGVQVSMFASQWLLTLFVHQLPPSVLLRVWDFFVVCGWSVMIQTAVALLHQEQGALLKLDMEGVLLHLKEARSRQQSEGELLRRVCNVCVL